MKITNSFWLILLTFISGDAFSIDCSPLEPKGGQNVNLETKGSVDGKIQGAFSKLIGAELDVNGAYVAVRSDTLKVYPNADQIYIWERFIYLNCEAIDESKLSDNDKLDRLERLQEKMMLGPPSDKQVFEEQVKSKYVQVLKDIRVSLYRKDEFMFPAMEIFLEKPTEENWRHVRMEASRNLEDVLSSIDRSLAYDAESKNQIDKINAVANSALSQAGKKYVRTFRETREQWSGPVRVLEQIETRKNLPTQEEALNWLSQLRKYYAALESEIGILVSAY